jgi:hypothetical protein
MARSVIKGCDREGEILESARLKKKAADKKYTQDFAANIAGRGQNVWMQWKTGTLRISDYYWVKLALALEFDPFETRPELRELAQLIHQADAIHSAGTTVEQFSEISGNLSPDQLALVENLIHSLAAK